MMPAPSLEYAQLVTEEVIMAEERDKPKWEFLPEPYPMTPEERAAAMAKAKAEFSAADLQRFTEVEEDIPMEQVLKELEDVHLSRAKGQE
jgi:hypothetical protein